MENLLQFDQLAQLSAGALVVAALAIIYLIVRAGSEGFERMSKRYAEGLEGAASKQADAFGEVVKTLKESLEGQRAFYETKVNDLRRDFDTEMNEARDRIAELERENSELKRKNTELEGEVERLKKQLDKVDTKVKRGKNAPVLAPATSR